MSANGSNNFLNIEDANLRVRSGSVHAQGMTIGGITVGTAHGLQSVTDTSNTTSNTLQFTNATTAFKATSNIELTSATKIIVDSNVVTEYTGPHDRPLRKYPEVALTQNDESATSGYVASASSTATYDTNLQPENAFNGVISPSSGTASWQSSDSGYSGTTPFNYLNSGTHTVSLTDTDGTVHYGDWLSLQTPNRIKVSYYKIHTLNDVDNYRPDSFVLLGSNSETDGTWKLLHTETNGMTDPGPEVYTGHVNSTEFYTYHRLLVKSLAGNGGEAYINELEYYGYEEGSGSLDTTLKTVYNVPATTGTQLEVYYDGQNYTSGTTVNDLSPNTNNGTLNSGVGFDSTYKAFTFDGTDDYIRATIPGVSGDYIHSISMWVKFTTMDDMILEISGSTRQSNSVIGVYIDADGTLAYFFYDNDARYHTNLLVNQWYHIGLTYSGSGKRNVYINGIEPRFKTSYGDLTQSLTLAGGTLTIGNTIDLGATSFFNGSIANFRLYSKVLSAGQVQELYDYQKDYFLGSKSQLTLYKGHLGVGVTEPSGQLELAGDERIQEYPPRAMTANETLVEGHGAFVTHGGHSNSAYAPWRAFNKELGSAGNFWIDIGPGYSHTAPYEALSTHSRTTLHDGSDLLGGWIDLVCPYPIKLSSVSIAPRTNYWQISLQRGVILGSNNGEDWYQIDTIDYNSPSGSTGTTAISNHLTNFGLTSTSYYSHIRLVCTHLTSQYGSSPNYDMHWQMGALVYFGTPGPTTLDKGSLTLGRSLDVPRVSRYDVDTETPRPEKLVVDYDTTVNSSPTDISGRGNHGTLVGATYAAADKAFDFSGNNVIYTPSLSPSMTGDIICSMSCWFKTDNSTTRQTVMWIGDDGAVADFIDIRIKGGYIGLSMGWDPDTSMLGIKYTDQALENNRWYHVVGVKSGTGPINSSTTAGMLQLYLDGVKLNTVDGGLSDSIGLSIPTTHNQLTIGASNENATGNTTLIGQISNSKLYSVALEPSEVRKLYNLGRTGRSMVISDTAVGIGKAPEAQLDVRGNLNVDGVITNQKPAFYAEMSNATSLHQGPGTAVFNDVLYNRGGCYSASTGLFTAPITGAYKFHCYGYAKGDGLNWWVRPWLNGSYWARGPYSTTAAAGEWIIPMNAGDTLGMYIPSNSYAFYIGTHRHNGFSGYLIG